MALVTVCSLFKPNWKVDSKDSKLPGGFSIAGAGAEYPADRGAPERGFQDRPGLLRAHQGKTEPGQRHGIDKRGRALDRCPAQKVVSGV